MSWGIKIAILYLGFVGLILGMAFTCLGQKVELESKDYYAKELKFQDQLDASANATLLKGYIEHKVLYKAVELTFPEEVLNKDFKGEVVFFRPSDSSKDITIQLKLSENGKQLIVDKSFVKGIYKMQISFSSNGKNFYKENIINFQ